MANSSYGDVNGPAILFMLLPGVTRHGVSGALLACPLPFPLPALVQSDEAHLLIYLGYLPDQVHVKQSCHGNPSLSQVVVTSLGFLPAADHSTQARDSRSLGRFNYLLQIEQYEEPSIEFSYTVDKC